MPRDRQSRELLGLIDIAELSVLDSQMGANVRQIDAVTSHIALFLHELLTEYSGELCFTYGSVRGAAGNGGPYRVPLRSPWSEAT